MAKADARYKPFYLGNFECVISNEFCDMLSITYSFKQNHFET